MRSWTGTIYGEPASKGNQRKLVTFGGTWATIGGRRTRVGGRPASIKSDKARAYANSVARQVPVLEPLLGGRLCLIATIYYATERPDLDESVILDALEKRIYKNDRQVREKHIYHRIDRRNPRVVVWVEEMTELGFKPTRPAPAAVARAEA